MKAFAQTFSLKQEGIFSFTDFNSIFLAMLIKHAPIKKRYITASQKNFMNRELNEAIMVRSKVCNEFLKLNPEENLSVDIITNF